MRFTLIGLIGITAALVGCSGEKSESDSPANPYADWKTYTEENVKFLYPAGHLHEASLGENGRNYVACLNQITRILEMRPYTDTLTIIYYTGFGQGQEMTGQEYPFGTDTAIHFWLPSFPGPTLMQHLLPRWVPGEPRLRFLKHGLISLFDFSGQNYHASTIGYFNQGRFIPLADLAVDATINSNKERYQSAEAASFCAYALARAGAFGLKAMYESELPFDRVVDEVFGVSVDSLETLWLQYVKDAVPPDSIIDSLWN